MTFAEAITAHATALSVDDNPTAVAVALEARAATIRAAGASIARVNTCLNAAKLIYNAMAAEAETVRQHAAIAAELAI